MRIAVFADLHGRILLAFKLCARWQRETGEVIDLIIQAGDLGTYPRLDYLDRATINHAKTDPTELGFAQDFVTTDPEVAAALAQTSCDMVYVRGNHEDHLWLDALERQSAEPLFPVDPYRRIFCLKTGEPYTFTRGDESVQIVGIGRIGQVENSTHHDRPKYVQPAEIRQLAQLSDEQIDILLTHDAARDFMGEGQGIAAINTLYERNVPAYHFFGHYGGPASHWRSPSDATSIWKLADLDWDPQSQMRARAGAMGILTWQSRDRHQFSVVDASWLKEYHINTWRLL